MADAESNPRTPPRRGETTRLDVGSTSVVPFVWRLPPQMHTQTRKRRPRAAMVQTPGDFPSSSRSKIVTAAHGGLADDCDERHGDGDREEKEEQDEEEDEEEEEEKREEEETHEEEEVIDGAIADSPSTPRGGTTATHVWLNDYSIMLPIERREKPYEKTRGANGAACNKVARQFHAAMLRHDPRLIPLGVQTIQRDVGTMETLFTTSPHAIPERERAWMATYLKEKASFFSRKQNDATSCRPTRPYPSHLLPRVDSTKDTVMMRVLLDLWPFYLHLDDSKEALIKETVSELNSTKNRHVRTLGTDVSTTWSTHSVRWKLAWLVEVVTNIHHPSHASLADAPELKHLVQAYVAIPTQAIKDALACYLVIIRQEMEGLDTSFDDVLLWRAWHLERANSGRLAAAAPRPTLVSDLQAMSGTSLVVFSDEWCNDRVTLLLNIYNKENRRGTLTKAQQQVISKILDLSRQPKRTRESEDSESDSSDDDMTPSKRCRFASSCNGDDDRDKRRHATPAARLSDLFSSESPELTLHTFVDLTGEEPERLTHAQHGSDVDGELCSTSVYGKSDSTEDEGEQDNGADDSLETESDTEAEEIVNMQRCENVAARADQVADDATPQLPPLSSQQPSPTSLEVEMTRLNDAFEARERESAAQRNASAQLKTVLGTIYQVLGSLQAEDAKKATEIARLGAIVESLKANDTKKTEEITHLKAENAKNNKAITRLSATVKALMGPLQDRLNEVDAYSGTIAAIVEATNDHASKLNAIELASTAIAQRMEASESNVAKLTSASKLKTSDNFPR